MTGKSPRGGWNNDPSLRTITPAAQVRRQLKSGMKPKKNRALDFIQAFTRLSERADTGRSLMRKYALDPDDIHAAVVYRRGDGLICSSVLPLPGKTDPFFAKFEQIHVDYLGICWWQTPADERGIVPMWIEEFNPGDKRAAIELLIYKNTLATLSVTALQERIQNED
jgi:hypothetical protein